MSGSIREPLFQPGVEKEMFRQVAKQFWKFCENVRVYKGATFSARNHFGFIGTYPRVPLDFFGNVVLGYGTSIFKKFQKGPDRNGPWAQMEMRRQVKKHFWKM